MLGCELTLHGELRVSTRDSPTTRPHADHEQAFVQHIYLNKLHEHFATIGLRSSA